MITKADIEQLTAEEKIFLVQEIWDSLAADPSQLPVSEEEKAILEKRWAEYLKNPEPALTLEQFKRRVSRRS